MTTKHRRGRDPEQHIVHASAAEANRYTGLHGELTLVVNNDQIVALRAHDGINPGGAVFTAVPTPTRITAEANTTVVVEHNMGLPPMVTAIGQDGSEVRPIAIGHTDTAVLMTFEDAGDYTIILR